MSGPLLAAQDNLVPNGDFEEELPCPGNLATLAHWFVPQNSVVDLNNLCPYIDWWRFIRDKKEGINGSQCGYAETYYRGFADDNIYSGRIYLAAKLRKPLEAGKEYYFEMQFRAVDTFPNKKLVNTVFTNSQDIAFTKEPPLFDFNIPRNYMELKPVVASPLYTDYEWHKLSHCFVADGTEHYLVIGNFKNDANTLTVSTGKRNPNFPNGLIANYAIDEVVLTAMEIPLTDTAMCVGDTLSLNVGKSVPRALAYRWQDGSTRPVYPAYKQETVRVEMIYSAQCRRDKQIRVTPFSREFPVQDQFWDTVICEGQFTPVLAGMHLLGENIRWEDGRSDPMRIIHDPGTYTADLSHRCFNSIRQVFKVEVESCLAGIYLANLFTPNGDGKNDEFRPVFKPDFPAIQSYELSIYNRWGELVFISRNLETGWDGRRFNQPVPPGVYLYSLRVTTQSRSGQRTHRKSGDVTLVY